MEIFLIRHGQTDGNRAWRHQHANTRLNDVGLAQVAKVLDAVAVIEPTHLVTSTNLRAVETARAIAESTGLIPETSPLFEELRRPTEIIGRRFIGLETFKYLTGWFYGASYGDGETYGQFIERLWASRQFLESYPKDARVVVVSHSVFINFFVEYRCRTKRMGLLQALWRFVRIMRHKNTGVTHLRFAPQEGKGKCTWNVLSHGRSAHLKP
ncbi:histidine phosphatase family protein [Patescibacteria group bacterium]|nr:histidine phosphatase family protein [Patescibacteria group bacterium]